MYASAVDRLKAGICTHVNGRCVHGYLYWSPVSGWLERTFALYSVTEIVGFESLLGWIVDSRKACKVIAIILGYLPR